MMAGRIPRNVWVAGWVSFFMDVSSEMVYPLVPLFLSSTLGVSKSVIGLIEGIAEATASLLKLFSGIIADRFGRNKLLMGLGYRRLDRFASDPGIGDRLGHGTRVPVHGSGR